MTELSRTFSFYRDCQSISFIRCITPIPGTSAFAEGSGFSLLTAREKCRSELAERVFQRSMSKDESQAVLGIAAHPLAIEAERNAWSETLETLFLLQIASAKPPAALSIGRENGLRLFVSRFGGSWLALFRIPHAGTFAIVQASSSSLVKAILKAWTEVRNIKIYSPQASELPRYTKGNRVLAKLLKFELPLGIYNPAIDRKGLSSFHHETASHHITYIKRSP